MSFARMALVLLSPLLFSQISFADECQVICPTIEENLVSALSENARSSLNRLITLARYQYPLKLRQRLRTKIIFCIGLSYDTFYVGGHPFVCSDFSGRKFGGFGAGVGFGAGISGEVFALMGRLMPGKEIGGTFSGGHISGSLGWYGASIGLFFRNSQGGILPESQLRERLYWIGYEAGFDLDFSAMELAISEI